MSLAWLIGVPEVLDKKKPISPVVIDGTSIHSVLYVFFSNFIKDRLLKLSANIITTCEHHIYNLLLSSIWLAILFICIANVIEIILLIIFTDTNIFFPS